MEKITLAGCAIVDSGRILLLNRKKRDWYELPGGKVREGESPEEAASRELKEEIMCEVKPVRRMGMKDFEEDGYTMTYVWFLGKIVSGEPNIGEPDTFDHLKFVPLDELENHRLSPNMQNFLQEIKDGNISL